MYKIGMDTNKSHPQAKQLYYYFPDRANIRTPNVFTVVVDHKHIFEISPDFPTALGIIDSSFIFKHTIRSAYLSKTLPAMYLCLLQTHRCERVSPD